MRTIGIQHRRKRTQAEEARPTRVAVRANGEVIEYALETDTDELDFLKGVFPVAWREVTPDEEIVWFDPDTAPQGFHLHQCKWKTVRAPEEIAKAPAGRVRTVLDHRGLPVTQALQKVPTRFDGLSADDRVAMLLGGSGDRFAAGLSRRGEEIGAQVYRVPGNLFTQLRGTADKTEDHRTLAATLEGILGRESSDTRPFYLVRPRDRDLIRVKECLRLRQDAMKDRIRCEQRILQSAVGQIFLNAEGRYPEGRLEDAFKELMANDRILQGLLEEEARRMKELKQAVRTTELWQEVFADIEGCGERIAASLIAPVGDIRRFWVDPELDEVTDPEERHRRKNRARKGGENKLKHFCGVHVLAGGRYAEVPSEKRFPRMRRGVGAGYHPDARQALVLLADQFNRRPESIWGKKLRHYKALYRNTHPEVKEVDVVVDGKRVTKKRYTDAHIHRTGLWRTCSKFVEALFRAWTRIERAQAGEDVLETAE